VYEGETHTAVDDKGRINIQQTLKNRMDDLGHTVWYATRGFDHTLFLYPEDKWNQLRGKLETSDPFEELDPKANDLRRFLMGSVAKLTMDSHNRFNLPAPLRQWADIERDAVILGVGGHLEIWSGRGWRAFQENQAEAYRRSAEETVGRRRNGVVGLPTEGA